ncbi:hypothetical protein [Aquibium carbonis]|uniref:hypothetical protein n=1 Tax=Aquibium carbonis TaxID=2495581 RepID=UPI001478AE48|nr:hypothetical protein [Aquibium carbonis]
MKTRLLTATAAALILCAPAFAQTATTTDAANSSASMSSAMPQGWNDEIGNAFFSDSELGTLRSDDEISANWNDLSSEQQAQVTTYCATIDTASATGLGGATTPSGDAASSTIPGDTTAGVTAGGTASPSIEGQPTTGLTGDTTAGATTGTMGTDANGGVSTDTTASTTPDGATGATGGMDAGANVNVASMQRLCDVVGALD